MEKSIPPKLIVMSLYVKIKSRVKNEETEGRWFDMNTIKKERDITTTETSIEERSSPVRIRI